MGDTDRGIGLVDVLAAGARRAVGIDPAVGLVDLNADFVVNVGINADRGKTGMAARVAVKRRNPHQTVNAGFRLEPAVCVVSADFDGCRLQPGNVAFRFLHIFHLILMRFRPAGIHSEQHFRPVLSLGAAAAGMNFEKGVVFVGFAGKQRFQLAAAGFCLQLLQLGYDLGNQFPIALLFRQFTEFA